MSEYELERSHRAITFFKESLLKDIEETLEVTNRTRISILTHEQARWMKEGIEMLHSRLTNPALGYFVYTTHDPTNKAQDKEES